MRERWRRLAPDLGRRERTVDQRAKQVPLLEVQSAPLVGLAPNAVRASIFERANSAARERTIPLSGPGLDARAVGDDPVVVPLAVPQTLVGNEALFRVSQPRPGGLAMMMI